jgi:hypothetical protein
MKPFFKTTFGLLGMFIMVLLASPNLLSAQNTEGDACPAIVYETLAAIGELCADTNRHEICYGSGTLSANARENAPSFQFETPGDVVTTSSIAELQLSESSDDWSVALLQLQGNLPNTPDEQNVTLLLVGNVTIENAVSGVILPVTATSNARIRSYPSSVDGDGNVVNVVPAGTVVNAVGRNEFGDWLRVDYRDAEGEQVTGWTSIQVLSNTTDRMRLDINEGSMPYYSPMQIFFLTTDESSVNCVESGVLAQTPEDAPAVDFFINNVQVTLSGTAFLQSDEGTFQFAVVEGIGYARANNVSQVVPAGTFVTVALDEDGRSPIEQPSYPEALDETFVQNLPISHSDDDLLPRPVAEIPVLDSAEVEAVVTTASTNIIPLDGRYLITLTEILTVDDTLITSPHGVSACHINANVGISYLLELMPSVWESENGVYGSSDAEHSSVLGPDTSAEVQRSASSYIWHSPTVATQRVSRRSNWIGGDGSYRAACIQNWTLTWLGN